MSADKGRFVMIDGLRGLAALSVVFFHFWPVMPGLQPVTPRFVDWLMTHANLGVEVFFVISGFVIAHSIGVNRITPSYLGNFCLRRSIRLDPPYWVTIALSIGIAWISKSFLKDRAAELPSVGAVLAHLAYLQDILGYKNIVPIFWTLCLEVQFYLVFCLLMGALQRLGLSPEVDVARGRISDRVLWVMAPVLVFALLWPTGVMHTPIWRGLFVPYWYLFLMGVLCRWSMDSRLMTRVSWGVLMTVFVGGATRSNGPAFVGALSAGLFMIAIHRGTLCRWLNGSVVQYLGRISYSLYLLHAVVGTHVLNLCKRFLPENVPSHVLVLALGIASSILAAHCLWKFVEQPCVQLTKRLRPARAPKPVVTITTLKPAVDATACQTMES